jgi:serine/threonine-protein kinase
MGNFDGRYQMIRRLGEGGMGEVWLAHDEQLNSRPVAIKIMRAQMLPVGEDAARFDREMRLAAQMQHSNIVTVFTTGTFNGAPYMVMEYLEGHDLSKMPPGGGTEQIVTIGRETCSALAYAHARDVIHRDIKPGNLFLCKTGQTKVTDFGIAKAMTGTKLSSSGVLVGTFAYMSPEQWLGESAAFSNDIWALGCAFYEFLSGRLPRECATVGEYASAAVRREAIPDLRSAVRVPDWLGGAVMAMLEPDPRSRPTAAQCLQLLSGAPTGSWATGQLRPGPVGPPTSTSQWEVNSATAAQGWPSAPTPPPVPFPTGATGQGHRSRPPKRGKKGRVIASLIGVAVLLIAGVYAARGAIFGSTAANNTAASGGTTPAASSPAASGNSAGSASASASDSGADTGGAIGGSSAAATGSATLTGVTTQVNVGAAPSFTYAAQGVPSGDSVVLQRTFGQAYEDVTPLSGANGPVTAPALDTMGKYSFRVAIESNGSVLSASTPVPVEAYGSVPLIPFNSGNGTVQVGNRVFSYADYMGSDKYPNYQQNQAWDASTCRSITMQFAGDSGFQQYGGTAYVEFVQTSSDPAYASTTPGVVKSVTVPLDGGPLYINASSTDDANVTFTATGSCYTPSGQPQA